jgi:hypothetical protein
MKSKLKKILEENLSEEETILLADGFESAFLGVGRQFGNPMAVYDRKKCIDILMKNMSYEEAEEYFQFNVEGAWIGEQTPIFLN